MDLRTSKRQPCHRGSATTVQLVPFPPDLHDPPQNCGNALHPSCSCYSWTLRNENPKPVSPELSANYISHTLPHAARTVPCLVRKCLCVSAKPPQIPQSRECASHSTSDLACPCCFTLPAAESEGRRSCGVLELPEYAWRISYCGATEQRINLRHVPYMNYSVRAEDDLFASRCFGPSGNALIIRLVSRWTSV